MSNNASTSEKVELTEKQKEVLREAYRLLLSWARETPSSSPAASLATDQIDNQTAGSDEITQLAAANHLKTQP
jgi:hypothetical protein